MADKTVQDFMPYWKNDVKYFEEAKIESKDTRIYCTTRLSLSAEPVTILKTNQEHD